MMCSLIIAHTSRYDFITPDSIWQSGTKVDEQRTHIYNTCVCAKVLLLSTAHIKTDQPKETFFVLSHSLLKLLSINARDKKLFPITNSTVFQHILHVNVSLYFLYDDDDKILKYTHP